MSADEESGKKWWWSKQVQDMNVVKPRTVKPADTISSALEIMNKLAVTGALTQCCQWGCSFAGKYRETSK